MAKKQSTKSAAGPVTSKYKPKASSVKKANYKPVKSKGRKVKSQFS
jgi:hypothetical protein